jgi:hypothetical protein
MSEDYGKVKAFTQVLFGLILNKKQMYLVWFLYFMMKLTSKKQLLKLFIESSCTLESQNVHCY